VVQSNQLRKGMVETVDLIRTAERSHRGESDLPSGGTLETQVRHSLE
jgi:hypothetical protein